MLGWEFFIARKTDAPGSPALATWRAGLGGTDWLKDLVGKGLAVDLGGNGYPDRYEISARTLVSTLAQGPPKHGGPSVIGDNYFLPEGWTSEAKIDFTRLRRLDPNEVLLVEVWDQS
jgi:hypothetical protein